MTFQEVSSSLQVVKQRKAYRDKVGNNSEKAFVTNQKGKSYVAGNSNKQQYFKKEKREGGDNKQKSRKGKFP